MRNGVYYFSTDTLCLKVANKQTSSNYRNIFIILLIEDQEISIRFPRITD
jgi:hypothetical protein